MSMGTNVSLKNNQIVSRMSLAIHGLNKLIDSCGLKNISGTISFLTFSDVCNVLVKPTLEYEQIKASLKNIAPHGTSNLDCALEQLKSVQQETRVNHNCTFLLVTYDCHTKLTNSEALIEKFLSLPFKPKLLVFCIATETDPVLELCLVTFARILSKQENVSIKANHLYEGGQICVPQCDRLSFEEVEKMFHSIYKIFFAPFTGSIVCGNMSCSVDLFPNIPVNFDHEEISTIHICGFFNLDEVSNQPIHTRHIVVPLAESIDDFKKRIAFLNVSNDMTNEELNSLYANQPSLATLLYKSFTSANMVALCQLNTSQQYGLLHSGTDSKKSNLILSTFEPGVNSIPWIQNLSHLKIDPNNPPAKNLSESKKKMSNFFVWIQQSFIQSDIQKLLRYSKKLPEKNDVVMAEARRIKRAANAFGFPELIDSLVELLKRESLSMPSNAHPEATNYMKNVIQFLKQKE